MWRGGTEVRSMSILLCCCMVGLIFQMVVVNRMATRVVRKLAGDEDTSCQNSDLRVHVL